MRSQLAELGVGMKKGAVVLAKHDPRWREAFLLLEQVFAQGGFRIHHMGSTAIPGIRAKPILDLLLVAPGPRELEASRHVVENLGFVWKGEHGIAGRRYSVLYDESGDTSLAHLHAFAAQHPEIERHLRFRDYLTSRADKAAAYEALKIELASRFVKERDKYTEGKASLISSLLEEAARR